QILDRKIVARHDDAKRAPRCSPADAPAFENGDAGAEPRRLEPDRQAGKAGADDTDVNVQIERKPRPLAWLARGGIGSTGRSCRNPDHDAFLRIDLALVTLSWMLLCRLIRVHTPSREATCAV